MIDSREHFLATKRLKGLATGGSGDPGFAGDQGGEVDLVMREEVLFGYA